MENTEEKKSEWRKKQKEYYDSNREIWNAYQKEYKKRKYSEDPEYRAKTKEYARQWRKKKKDENARGI